MSSPTVRAIPKMRVPSLNFPKCIEYSSIFFSFFHGFFTSIHIFVFKSATAPQQEERPALPAFPFRPWCPAIKCFWLLEAPSSLSAIGLEGSLCFECALHLG